MSERTLMAAAFLTAPCAFAPAAGLEPVGLPAHASDFPTHGYEITVAGETSSLTERLRSLT